MQTKEIISSIYVHVAQDSSAFILLHEHSKVGLFKITYTNCPGNVLSGKVIVRETSVIRRWQRCRLLLSRGKGGYSEVDECD